MTSWPLFVAEIGLYAVLSGLMIAIALDARTRWKQLLAEQDEPNDAAPEPDDGAEVSMVRPKPHGAPDDTNPPPLAS